MPHFLIYGLLALWLLPTASLAAGEEALPAPSQQQIPSSGDYPEDFSLPAEDTEALENRYAAFGEEEAQTTAAPPAPQDLMQPFEAPDATSSAPVGQTP